MAISKVADRGTANSNSTITAFNLALVSLTVGNFLIIRTAADNSGASGAARTLTITNQTGTAIDTGTLQQFQQNNDPGAASEGVTCNVVVAAITDTSGTIRFAYSGSVRQAAVVEEWTGLTGVVVGSPVGANGVNSTNLASCADASAASGNLVYGAMAVEGPSGDTYTQDADTTNGSWSNLTKLGLTNATATDNVTVYGGYKVVTGTGAQTYDPTINNARDSAGIILELAAVVTVDATLAAPLGSLTAAVTATPDHPATLAAPLGGLTAAVTATVEAGAPTIDAVLDAPLGGLTAAVTATPDHAATLAAPLGSLVAEVTAAPDHPASLDAPLGGLTAAVTADVEPPGDPAEEPAPSTGGSPRNRRTGRPQPRSIRSGGGLHFLVEITGTPGPILEVAGNPVGISATGTLLLAATASAVPKRVRSYAAAHQRISGQATFHAAHPRPVDPDEWLILDLPRRVN